MSQSLNLTITTEWIKDQIKKVEQEQAEAHRWFFDAKASLTRAKAEYKAAMESVETTARVLQGLRNELAAIERPEEAV